MSEVKSNSIEEGHGLHDISCGHGSRWMWWPGMDGTGAWMYVVRASNCRCGDPPRPHPVVKCRDKAHRPDQHAKDPHWCQYATEITDPEDNGYLDGRCRGLIYRCEKTGKVVVYNKRCDSIFAIQVVEK